MHDSEVTGSCLEVPGDGPAPWSMCVVARIISDQASLTGIFNPVTLTKSAQACSVVLVPLAHGYLLVLLTQSYSVILALLLHAY